MIQIHCFIAVSMEYEFSSLLGWKFVSGTRKQAIDTAEQKLSTIVQYSHMTIAASKSLAYSTQFVLENGILYTKSFTEDGVSFDMSFFSRKWILRGKTCFSLKESISIWHNKYRCRIFCFLEALQISASIFSVCPWALVVSRKQRLQIPSPFT